MQIKTGIDMVSVSKIKKVIVENPDFIDEIFTPLEQSYSLNKKRCYEHFAARFAAKEAFVKAIGTGIGKGIHLKSIEVSNDFITGKPHVSIYGQTKEFTKSLGVFSMDISLSHTDDLAIAQVVLLLE
ncbi:holo-ACP synthase [Paenibacillus sp. PR3]|uniref:Holo-[acyl-carrier-protein] synthase n=1 Tax=Paenibacillus terricola TaxID=2763503 RepID=A0ABR8N3U6_9BACL|nr:holo-ACP synthase [Paenibacillus terricola]MBD3922201.1 holo-ACP synthase [Paenibacillus terricola]